MKKTIYLRLLTLVPLLLWSALCLSLTQEQWQQQHNHLFKLYEQGKYSSAVRYGLELVKETERSLPQTLYLAKTLNTLGLSYNGFGKPDIALDYYKKSEILLRDINQVNTDPYIAALNNIASIKSNQAEYSSAANYFIKAIDLELRLNGNEKPNYAKMLMGLGLVNYKQRNYLESQKLYLEALEIFEKNEKDSHYGSLLHNLGALYEAQHQIKKAEQAYLESLTFTQQFQGDKHPAVAFTMVNLANLYYNQERYQRALSYYNQAYDIYDAQGMKNHPDFADAVLGLAKVARISDQIEQAHAYHELAVSIYKASYPSNHPQLAAAHSSWARVYQQEGQLEKAIELFKKAEPIYRRNRGYDKTEADTYYFMGAAYLEQGNLGAAHDLLNQALTAQKKLGFINDQKRTLNKLIELEKISNQPYSKDEIKKLNNQLNVL